MTRCVGDDDLSHALRTPLTVILGYLELLNGQDTDVDDETRTRMLALVELHARRLLTVVDGLARTDPAGRAPQ